MLSDLIFVLKHIKNTIEKYALLDVYTNYANTLEQIASSSSEELQAQLKSYRSQIKEAHEQLEPSGWSYSQIKIFERFGARGLVGVAGYDKFQKALSENAANTPGAVAEIRLQQQNLTQLLTNSSSILTSLGPLAEDGASVKEKSNVQIVFDEGVKIDNLTELSSRSKEWKEIIRAYSLLADVTPEETVIVTISKSNPLEVLLTTLPLISRAIYYTVKPFLDLYNEVLKAKEHAFALEKMQIDVATDRLELIKKIEAYETKKVQEIMLQVANDHKAPELDTAKYNEAEVALLKAGPDLYKFITSGGKVDAKDSGENKENSSKFQLEPVYQETYKLRDKVQMLLSEAPGTEEKSVPSVPDEKITAPKKSKKTKPKKRQPVKKS